MITKRTMRTAALALALGACAMEPIQKPELDDRKDMIPGKAEAWGPSDNPNLFNGNLEFRFDQLPASGTPTNIPWAGNYWPTYQDNINHRWDGPDSDSPAKKYEKAFGLTGVEDAVSRYHGIDANRSRKACEQSSECDSKIGETCAKRVGATKGRCIPTWWGICHAWAPAAILVPEPRYPVTYNGVTFKVNDIKALVSLVHENVTTKFISLRCNRDAQGDNEITYDEYGRPNAECKDTNPGTFHVILANYVGIMKQSFVYDRTWDDEVWNQPIAGYRLTQLKEISMAEANRLVGVTSVGGTTVTRTGTVARNAWAHQGSFPVAAGQSVKVVMTGTADADLYVRFGAEPTASQYDCRPYGGDSNETCELTVPAGVTTVYVSVQGYADSSSFTLKVTTGGSTPTTYPFNERAVKFYHVKLEVDFITESSASTDGNLSADIARYTSVDRMEYVLEIDREGKIIGGEWVGESKRHHPDFLWLPTGVRTNSSVAGGKITYARVKELLDRSLVPPGGGSGAGTLKTVRDGGTVARGAWKHYGPFQVAPGKTLTATLTGDNDADLYVRKGAAPTASTYDCRPYKNGSDESCSVVGPGAVYVAVQGYATTSQFQLVIEYTEGTGTTPPVDPPVGIQHLNVSDAVAQGEQKVYSLDVPAGAKLVIRTTAPNDVDLYIQMNQAPTTAAYLARAWTTSGNETIRYSVPSNGRLYIMVDGYQASSFTLTTASE